MARRIEIPSQLYPVGVYTQTIDNFNPNTTRIAMTFTRESWPGTQEDTVMEVTVTWSNGQFLASKFPGGVWIGRDGQPVLVHPFVVTVPFESDGSGGRRRKNVISAVFKMQVFQALTTAIAAEAL